jgi:hypothetical protein
MMKGERKGMGEGLLEKMLRAWRERGNTQQKTGRLKSAGSFTHVILT